MKKVRRLLICCLVFVLALLFSAKVVKATKGLDEIEEYIVTVEPDFHDGSLKMNISLTWKVLDDKTDGPLTWIKVGVPNCYVENLKALSSNIKEIKYSESDGAFIRIDLDRSYHQGEELKIEFSWIQTHMYILEGNVVYYDYNPGWFDDIKVNHCEVRWKMKDVAEITESTIKPEEKSGYYVWSSQLNYGEYIKVNLFYDKASFLELDPKMQYTNRYMTTKSMIILIALISGLSLIIIGLIIHSYQNRDPYLRERGFIVHRGFFYTGHISSHYYRSGVSSDGKQINPPVPVSSGHYGGSGGCACACACACAGGGRAGCSMKDFYHTNLASDNVLSIIKKTK